MRWWVDRLSGLPLYNVDRYVIAQLYDELLVEPTARTGKPRDPNTIVHYINALRMLFKTAVAYGLAEDIPPLPKPRRPDNRRMRWLTVSEAMRLRDELPDWMRPPYLFTLATGLRHNNVTLLEWKQLDLDRRIAIIPRTKNGRPIGIPLNDDAMDALLSAKKLFNHPERVFMWKSQRRFKGPFIRTMTATDYIHARREWKDAMKRAGIEDFKWHDLRHTWATWHIQAGTTLYDLQVLGGWSNIENVKRYAHLAPDVMHDQVDRLMERASAIQRPRTHLKIVDLSSGS